MGEGPSSPMAEPMTLGSPTHGYSHSLSQPGGPHSVGTHHSQGSAGQQSGFLPGYLMGQPGHSASPSSSRLWSASRSPTKGLTPASLGPRDSMSRLDRSDSVLSQRSPTKGLTPASLGPRDSMSRLDRSDSVLSQSRGGMTTPAAKDHGNAPPVAGLYDTVDSPHGPPAHQTETPDRRQIDSPFAANRSTTSMHRHGSDSTHGRLHSQTSVGGGPASLSRSFSLTPQGRSHSVMSPVTTAASPAQIDPFYTQGETIGPEVELDQTWVTVFGFPPAAASYILQQFSQYGNIQKHVVASNGNWMHLQFTSKLQAKKALSKNGKIFGGNIMIGVTPCIDKGVMECGKENLYSTNLAETPNRRMTASVAEEEDFSKRKTPIRPLTAAYHAATSQHKVAPDHNTPQKSNSVISKTLEYMLGW